MPQVKTLNSMTGYGGDEGRVEGFSWRWELRSVNGRGLDMRLRLPTGAEALESKVREAVAAWLSRGNVTINLSLVREGGGVEIRLNEKALDQVLKAVDAVRARTDAARPSADVLLGLRGVLEVAEVAEGEAAAADRHARMLASLEVALTSITASRQAEGQRLALIVHEQLAEMERLLATISASPTRSVEAIRTRLREQIARVLEVANGLDPSRLHQEAALIAVKADIEEELQRLKSHVAAARDLLAEGGPVGRKLDFLSQEFNREANTLCSKSSDIEITQAGLSLKALIEQMREQIQNIE